MVDAGYYRYQPTGYSFMDFDPLAYSNHMRQVLLPEIERDLARSFGSQNYRNYGPVNSSNDGKFSWGTALGNFAKGFFSPITNMFSSPGNFFKGLAMIGVGVAVVALGGAPLLIAAGVAYGGFKALQFGYKLATARNGDEAEQAFYNLGEGSFALLGSYAGARMALNSARNAGAAIASADDVANMSQMQALRYNLQADTLKTSFGAVRTNASARLASMQGATASQHTGAGASHQAAGAQSTTSRGMGEAVLLDKNGAPLAYYDPATKQWVNIPSAGHTVHPAQLQGNQPQLLTGPRDNVIYLGDGTPKPLLPHNGPAGYLAPPNHAQTAAAVRHYRHQWNVAQAPADKASTGVTFRGTDPVYNVTRNYVHDHGLLYPLKSNGHYNTRAPILEVMGDGSFAPYTQVA